MLSSKFFCKHKVLLYVIIMGLAVKAPAQVDFRQDARFVDKYRSKSNISIGMADINGDGWDDIVRLNDQNHLELFMFAHDGKEVSAITADDIEGGFAWSMAIANLDNDLTNEIFLGVAFSDLKVLDYSQNEGITIRQSITNQAYTQSSTMADINNDGWLDVFVCADDGTSKILKNDGAGSLVEDSSLINLNTRRPSDNSGNYGSEWTDIDSDGDLDLYISKCKGGVTNPNDPRRINVLYINDGSGHYEEQASAFKLNFGQQSWASSFADFDNDGDIDGIVAHHGAPHSFLENVDNVFQDRSFEIGSLESFAYQVITRDFDNNGFIDVLLCGDKDFLLWNHGDFKFDVTESPFRHYNMMAAAAGDVDRNGFLDLIGVIGGIGLNEAGPVNDILWLNKGNDYNYVSFRLNGTQSNANGVGARIQIFGEWGVQTRELKAGESYSISNSLNLHFGLGVASAIDKVKVLWPSGNVDTYEDIAANQFYNITENGCISTNKSVSTEAQTICDDQPTILQGIDEAVWSDGNKGKDLAVDAPGIYFYKHSDDQSCIESADPIMISHEADEQILSTISDTYVSCFNELVTVSYIRPDGSRNDIDLVNGQNVIKVDGACTQLTKDVTLVSVLADLPTELKETVSSGEDVTLVTPGQELRWYLNEDSAVPFYKGDSITIERVESDREYYVEAISYHQYESDYLGEYSHTGTNQYSGNQLSGGLYFDVLSAMVLEEFSVYTDTEGVRTIIIQSSDGSKVYEEAFSLSKGRNRLMLNAELNAGLDYFILTDEDANMSRLGHYSPRLVRSNTETKYPYKVQDLMQINNSSFGPTYFLYFYDWQVKPADLECVSDRVPFTIVVESSTSINEEFSDSDVILFPNPADQTITMAYPPSYRLRSFQIFNTLGQMVKTNLLGDQVNLSTLPSGMYTTEIKFDQQIVKKQLLIQH